MMGRTYNPTGYSRYQDWQVPCRLGVGGLGMGAWMEADSTWTGAPDRTASNARMGGPWEATAVGIWRVAGGGYSQCDDSKVGSSSA